MYTCAFCNVLACAGGDREKMPGNCPMRQMDMAREVLPAYAREEYRDFYRNSSEIEGEGYGQWPRLREVAEFARKMQYQKIGLAFCKGLHKEARIVADYLRKQGFEVVSVICKTGGISKEQVGIPEEKKLHPGEF